MKKTLNRTALQKHSQGLATFANRTLGITLRPYQLEAAQAVINSIREGAGRTIVILFSRQSGKDELAANLKVYLLARRHTQEVGIVEVNPTYKPQTINAIAAPRGPAAQPDDTQDLAQALGLHAHGWPRTRHVPFGRRRTPTWWARWPRCC